VRSASRLYRLILALSGLGLAIVALAGAGAVRGLRLDPGSLEALASACGSMIPALDLGGHLLLALGLLAASSLTLGVRSLARQLRATRSYVRGMRPTGERLEVAGASCSLTAERAPRAFCAGYLIPRVYVSRGALEALTGDELRAVLAHELHHRRRRDPLRLLVARALADALFFLPALKPIARRYAALVELAADEAAVHSLGGRSALARALLKFGDLDAPTAAVAGIAPERVDHLGGAREAGRWRLSPSSLIATASAAAILLAATMLLFSLPGAASVNLPLALAQSCMVLMLGGALGVALAGAKLRRPIGRVQLR
jgi:Zn-dependent protease with chaperone function